MPPSPSTATAGPVRARVRRRRPAAGGEPHQRQHRRRAGVGPTRRRRPRTPSPPPPASRSRTTPASAASTRGRPRRPQPVDGPEGPDRVRQHAESGRRGADQSPAVAPAGGPGPGRRDHRLPRPARRCPEPGPSGGRSGSPSKPGLRPSSSPTTSSAMASHSSSRFSSWLERGGTPAGAGGRWGPAGPCRTAASRSPRAPGDPRLWGSAGTSPSSDRSERSRRTIPRRRPGPGRGRPPGHVGQVLHHRPGIGVVGQPRLDPDPAHARWRPPACARRRARPRWRCGRRCRRRPARRRRPPRIPGRSAPRRTPRRRQAVGHQRPVALLEHVQGQARHPGRARRTAGTSRGAVPRHGHRPPPARHRPPTGTASTAGPPRPARPRPPADTRVMAWPSPVGRHVAVGEGHVVAGRHHHHQVRRRPPRAVRPGGLPVGEVGDAGPRPACRPGRRGSEIERPSGPRGTPWSTGSGTAGVGSGPTGTRVHVAGPSAVGTTSQRAGWSYQLTAGASQLDWSATTPFHTTGWWVRGSTSWESAIR